MHRNRRWTDLIPRLPETFSTARLRLRPARSADYLFLSDLIKIPVVRRYLGGPPTPVRLEQTLVGLTGSGHRIVEKAASQEPVGLVDLGPYRTPPAFELSYQFHPNQWGHGYATEATEAICAHWRKCNFAAPLVAETQSANGPSRRLLTRLGFEETERLQRFGAEQIVYRLAS